MSRPRETDPAVIVLEAAAYYGAPANKRYPLKALPDLLSISRATFFRALRDAPDLYCTGTLLAQHPQSDRIAAALCVLGRGDKIKEAQDAALLRAFKWRQRHLPAWSAWTWGA